MPTDRPYRIWPALGPMVTSFVLFGCGNVGDQPDISTSAIHANPGSIETVASEPDSSSTGVYNEVMNFKIGGTGCTGTVVGPYAVLSANHCTSGSSPSIMSINYTDLGDIPVGNVFYNPYLNPTFTPAWWVNLNNQQKAAVGGRQDDWPAQHDQVILFVPELTPARLAQSHITPALIGAPPSGTFIYQTVGVASTPSGASRASIFSRIINAIPNTITQSPRDGYITEDQSTPNYGSVDPGDSGGPMLGFSRLTQLFGGSVDVGHFVVGTTQNTGGDKAPLAYATGSTLTPNQTLTIRLNSLWAQAQIDDADGDGLPTACDRNPASRNPGGDNLCPTEVGGPTGASLVQTAAATAIPLANLACKPGYSAVAMRGRSGALVDDLAVRCEALGCFNAAPGTCNQTYWTDDLGGTGGGPFEMDCANGSLLTGIQGQHTAGALLTSMQGVCNTFTNTNAGSTAGRTALTLVGGAGPQAYTAFCPAFQTLVGFQARSYDPRWVTGLQPICSTDLAQIGTYIGGTGGVVAELSCPAGDVATGVVYQTDPSHVEIGFSGIICAPQATVQAGQVVPVAQLAVAHGSTYDVDAGIDVPAMVEPLDGAHFPISPTSNPVNQAFCPTGFALSRISGGRATNFVTGLLGSITTLGCRQVSSPTRTATVSVNAGNLSLPVVSSSCRGTALVDGLYTQSGALSDGIAVHCNHL